MAQSSTGAKFRCTCVEDGTEVASKVVMRINNGVQAKAALISPGLKVSASARPIAVRVADHLEGHYAQTYRSCFDGSCIVHACVNSAQRVRA
jgi:hypothetical protein